MKITIDFDEKNLTQLLKAVHFGAWVKNATKVGDEIDAAMEEFEQYVLGTVFNAGEKTRISVDQTGGYDLSPEFDDVLYEQIQEYDDDTFWDSLIHRLAERDWMQKNPGKLNRVETDKDLLDRAAAIDREKEKYDKEFEDRGVERLRLVR